MGMNRTKTICAGASTPHVLKIAKKLSAGQFRSKSRDLPTMAKRYPKYHVSFAEYRLATSLSAAFTPDHRFTQNRRDISSVREYT